MSTLPVGGRSAVLRRACRALESRSYRSFFMGNAVSLLGSALQQVALAWFVYRLTGSKLVLGTVGFLQQAPGALFVPLAGALSDRVSGRSVLIMAQAGLMLQAGALCWLMANGLASVPVVFGLCTLQGFLNAIDLPVRQAILPELLGSAEEMPSAIALNSALFNAARVFGPALAGVLVSSFGEMPCVFLNTVSYLPVLLALFAMGPLRPKAVEAPRSPIWRDIGEGLQYVWLHRPFRDLLLLLAAEALLGLSYVVLFPVLASEELHGGPYAMGILTGSAGVGSLVAALRLASRRNLRGMLKSIALSATLSSGALMAFAVVRSLPFAAALAAIAGFGFISVSGASNTILQTLVDDRLRGRVLSLYSLTFVAMTPVGNLMLGAIAEHHGARQAIAVFGALLMSCALVFYARLASLREAARPIYIERGLIPWEK